MLIAVLGHGVVGSGVVEVLSRNHDGIAARAKEPIEIKYILDLRDFPELPYADKFIKDFSVIENDPEIRVVVESIGGLKPAYDFVRRSLLAGKSVVTSNKELVAEKGQELLQIAQDNNLNFLFEASVGGGIPIIRPLTQCMAANELVEVAGILNGTTNFILTKMIADQMSFDDALAMAQQLGYAERDPSADVDGTDACRKICILASLAFGKHVNPGEVPCEGIRGISLTDVACAGSWGGVIKLLGTARTCRDGRLEVCVAPMLVPKSSQLAWVSDVFNGILVRGNATGDVMFYGKGAGKLPTASAVVADVIDCLKHISARKYLYWGPAEEGMLLPTGLHQTALYLRVAGDANAMPALAAGVFGEVELIPEAPGGETAFVTRVAPLGEHMSKVGLLKAGGAEVRAMLRVFGMDEE